MKKIGKMLRLIKISSVVTFVFGLYFIQKNPMLRRSVYILLYVAYERATNAKKARAEGYVIGVEDITRQWLENQLRERYYEVEVESVKARGMGANMGNASEMFRLDIKYKKQPEKSVELPSVMVLKTPKKELKGRVPFTVTRMNEMEACFFSEVESTLASVEGVRFPASYATKTNDVGNMFVLMEDIQDSGAVFMTEQEPIYEVKTAMEVCRGLARFHVPLWDSPRLEKGGDLYETIIGQNDPVLCMTGEFMKVAWPKCLQRIGNRMPKELISRGSLLIQIAQRLHDCMSIKPNTVCHGDCHLENCYLFPSDNEVGWELGLYDFQLMRRGNGALDLATFMGGSCVPGLFDENEIKLFQTYLNTIEELRGNLVYHSNSGEEILYSIEDIKHDFRIALGVMFCWNVAAVLAVPFNTEAVSDYDEYFIRLCETVTRMDIVNYCLIHVGGNQSHLNKRLVQSGVDITKRGTQLSWEVPPVLRVIDNHDRPHESHGFETHRSLYRFRLPGMYNSLVYNLKYRFMLRMTTSRAGYHNQKTTGIPDAILEGHHSVNYARGTSVEHSAFDSYYVSAFSPFNSASPSLALRWCKRTIDDKGEVWLMIKTRDGVYTWVENPSTECNVVYEADNSVVATSFDKTCRLELTCVVPMERWSIRYRGKVRCYKTGSLVDSSFDLEWTKTSKAFSFGTDVSPSLTAKSLAFESFSKKFFDELKAAHQEHYEQFGLVEGHVTIGSTTLKVEAKGMRDRAFGIRDWGYMQRYVSSYFWTGEMQGGNCFNITMASLPTLSNAKFGFVNIGDNCKENQPVEAISGSLPEISHDGIPPSKVTLCFVAGKEKITYSLQMFIEEGDTIPLNMGPDGMLVNFRFAKYEISWIDPMSGNKIEEVGYGGSEFSYRFKGVVPTKPRLTDLDIMPVSRGFDAQLQ